MKIASSTNLPQQINNWVTQARSNDQSPNDKDTRPDFVNWSGPGLPYATDGDAITRIKGQFDSKGPLNLSMNVDTKVDAFFTSEMRIKAQREGDLENYTVRLHHPSDSQCFDFRASFSRNVNTGEVQNEKFKHGPPTGLALARDILTSRIGQTAIGVGAGFGSIPGFLLGAGTGAAIGAACGAVMGYMFAMEENAYGLRSL